MKTPIIFFYLLMILIIVCAPPLQAFPFKGLSKKQEKKLNELIESSNPIVPMFGKIETPIQAGVSISTVLPSTVNFQGSETESLIKLAPQSQDTVATISDLEIHRENIQKIEEEGLNFIQPSLMLTQEEQLAIDEFFTRNEQEQLLDLWKATIARNKTIQFIIQKLSPANSAQEANSLLSKTIGAAIFLPFYALQAISDSAGAYYGSQVGGRVLGSVVEGKMKKNQVQMQLSQTESIILFMMIDEVAERLRQRYHAYKKLMVERALAANELEESKKDILDAYELNEPSAKVLANIQRRSVEREIRNIDAQMRFQKNALVELAGPTAINSLDEQLKIELAAAQNSPLDFIDVTE